MDAVKITIDIQASGMCHFSSAIFSGARIFASVLHHHLTDIYVRNHVAVHSYVLANHEPATLLRVILFTIIDIHQINKSNFNLLFVQSNQMYIQKVLMR